MNIVIFGAGGHAQVVIDILEKINNYKIVGLIDNLKAKGKNYFGYDLIGSDIELSKLILKYKIEGFIIAIGNNKIRKQLYENISNNHSELKFINAIHPSAQIGKSVKIGDGVAMFANAVVNSGCVVENGCIINTAATLDHGCIMKQFSSLGPGVHTGGEVYIGEQTTVSIGAIISNGIKIGNNSLIGSSSFVNRDIYNNAIVYGVPARFVRDNI